MSKKRLLFLNGLNKVIVAVVNRLNILRVVFLHWQWEKGGRWGEEESSKGGIIFFFLLGLLINFFIYFQVWCLLCISPNSYLTEDEQK